jgi:hypothetical protein
MKDANKDNQFFQPKTKPTVAGTDASAETTV